MCWQCRQVEECVSISPNTGSNSVLIPPGLTVSLGIYRSTKEIDPTAEAVKPEVGLETRRPTPMPAVEGSRILSPSSSARQRYEPRWLMAQDLSDRPLPAVV